MAQSYKGSITFGMVYIPITLHTVIKNNDISFNMLDKTTHSRVKYKKTCEECDNREVKQGDIIKGFEYESGKYVVFEDSDFDKLKTKKDKSIIIEEFVTLSEIDPIFYDKSYYVKPEGAEKAFNLFKVAMEKENKVAIAKTMLGSKETLIAIRVRNGEMVLNSMYFADEVQKNPVNNISDDLNSKELELAVSIINNMTVELDLSKYKDEYRERLLSAIETKINGKEIVAVEQGGENKIVSLMEALQSSLKLSLNTSKPKTQKAKSKVGVLAMVKPKAISSTIKKNKASNSETNISKIKTSNTTKGKTNTNQSNKIKNAL